jgi:hypothetical protein
LLGTARRRWKWREEVSGEQRVTAAYNLVRARKLLAEEIVPTNQCFRNALNVLSAAEGKLKRATIKESAVKPELDKQLERCASMLEKSRIALEQRRKSYWENSLFAEPAEKMTWMIELDDKNRVHSIPPKELAEHERIFEKAEYLRQLVKRIDLDARFQVRVAVDPQVLSFARLHFADYNRSVNAPDLYLRKSRQNARWQTNRGRQRDYCTCRRSENTRCTPEVI